MRINFKIYLGILVLAFSTTCSTETLDSLKNRLSHTDNTDEMWQVAEEIKSKGKDGIPVFLSVLSSIKKSDKSVVLEYGRINVCLSSLYDLAKEGKFIIDEVPILIETFDKQLHISDTLITAEILRIITGVDPDYSDEFVKQYEGTKEDEEVIQAKIAEWRNWYSVHPTKSKSL